MIKKRLKAIYIITALLGVFVTSLFSFVPINAKTIVSSNYTLESALGERNNATMETIVTINLNNYYTGTMTFSIKNPYNAQLNYYCKNAKIQNSSKTSVQLYIKQEKYIELHLYFDSTALTSGLYNAGLISSNSFASASNFMATNWSNYMDINRETSVNITVDVPDNTEIINAINNNTEQLKTVAMSFYPDYANEFIIRLSNMGATWDTETMERSIVARSITGYTSSQDVNEFFVLPHKTLHLIYYSNSAFLYLVKRGATSDTDYIDGYNRIAVSNLGGIVLMHVYIENNTDTTQYGYWYMNNGGQWFRPVYWGYDVPDEVCGMIGIETKTNGLIGTIINILNGNNNSTNTNINNAANDIVNETNEVNTLTNDYSNQITSGKTDVTNAINDINLGGLANAGVFVANVMQSLYNNMGDYKILVTIPLIVGILLLIINKPRLFEPSETERSNTLSWHDSNGNVHQTQKFTVTKKTYGRRESSTYWRRLD